VAVIPILGFMGYHNWLAQLIGTATEGVIASVRQAAADRDTDAILLWADSPGGEATGVEELAAEIQRTRKVKPVIGIADAFAASAAYWPSAC
jgi:ClpP class serine protease